MHPDFQNFLGKLIISVLQKEWVDAVITIR